MAHGDPLPKNYYANTAPVVEDWADMVRFEPGLYARPKSLDELQQTLSRLVSGGLPADGIRVLGGLHSCAHICECAAVIDVTALPQTLEFDADDSAVVATANWHLHAFLEECGKRGKSLAATGGTDAQTLAGLISTNTAPATPKHTVYETLEWVEYFTIAADGSVQQRRVSRGDADFGAVVCSLGAIGMITKVRFGLIDQPYFETVQKIVHLDDVLADLDKTSAEYDFWRVDWVPDTKRGLLWAARRIPKEQADPNGDYPTDKTEGILRFLMGAIEKIENSGAFLDTALRVVYEVLMATYGTVKANGPLRNMLPVDRRAPLHVAMAEWSFAPKDLPRTLEACRAYFEAAKWPNLPIEIELVKTDDYFMSPWTREGEPYLVKFNFEYLTDFLSDDEKKALVEHLRGLWGHLRAQGIPFKAHWGKINFMDPAFVRENFQYDRFEPLVSPPFVNGYIRERLGTPRQVAAPAMAGEVAAGAPTT